MATQPPTEPNRIEPQSPPEAPPAPAEPIETHPSETEPLSPDFYQPERSPEELPGLNLSHASGRFARAGQVRLSSTAGLTGHLGNRPIPPCQQFRRVKRHALQ